MFWIILRQDLLIAFRNLGKIFASALFFVIFIALASLLAQTQSNQAFDLSIVIWLALLSTMIFSSSEFLKRDAEDGNLEQMLIIFPNFEIFILARIIANWLVCCLPLAILLPFIKPEINFLILFLFASFSINTICCFCGSLSVLASSAPMIAIVALPLIIPIILISYGNFWTSLNLLIGISLFLAIVLSFSAARIIKISEE